MSDLIKGKLSRLAAGMRSVWAYLAISVAISAVAAGTCSEPIASNTFLRTFLPSEYMATLIVFVTVTLASIVTIHVKLTTMTEGDDARLFQELQATRLRKKANNVARFLLIIPVAAFAILILDGSIPEASQNRAWTFSVLIALFFAATAATYEVHRIVISLSELPDRQRVMSGVSDAFVAATRLSTTKPDLSVPQRQNR